MTKYTNFSLLILIITIALISCAPKKIANNPISSMKMDVTYLAADELEGRLIGSRGEQLAAEYISKRYAEIGLEKRGDNDSYFQKFSVKPVVHPHSTIKDTSEIHGKNIVSFIDNKAEKTIIIGAHYDHLGYGQYGGSLYPGSDKQIHNGADDNASGIAALLALSERMISKKQTKFNYLFLAFSGEEEGLWGSNHYSKNPTIDFQNAAFMINMDMVGRLDKERRLAIYGTGTASDWDEVIDDIKEPLFVIKKDPSGMGPSDHTSFYLEGIPVLHFFTGQHEDYHKPSDDEHKINYDGIKSVVDFIDILINKMEDRPYPQFIKTKDKDTSKSKGFKVTLGVMPDYMFSGMGMRIDGVKDDRPAFNAGLLKGDIVTKLGDVDVKDMSTYMEALGKYEKGQTVKVVFEREGKRIEKDLTF